MLQMPEKELSKLIAILGKLGSEYENERDAAGQKAHQIVSRYGTWDMLLRGSIPVEQPPVKKPKSPSGIKRKRTAKYACALEWATKAMQSSYYKVIPTCIDVIAILFGRTFDEVRKDLSNDKPARGIPGKKRKTASYRDAIILILRTKNDRDAVISLVAAVFYRTVAEVQHDLIV